MGKLRFGEKEFKKLKQVLSREILQRYLFFWVNNLIALYFIKSAAGKKFIKILKIQRTARGFLKEDFRQWVVFSNTA